MKHLGFVVAVALLGGSWAGVAVAAPDCTFTTTSLNGYPASLIFSNTLTVLPGETANCVLSAPTFSPHSADEFVLYSADYRGNVEDGDTATIAINHDGTSDGATIPGPSSDPVYRDYMTSNTNGDIKSKLHWSLSSDSSAVGDLDTIDYDVVATTTKASVQASINQLATQQTSIVTHLNTTSDLLTGGNQPFEQANNVSAFGALGSFTTGVTGHYNLLDGFSISGGAAYTSQPNAAGVLFAGAVRYLQPETQAMRFFGEAGANGAPSLAMTFTRHYDDGSTDGATITATGTGYLTGVYVEGGVLLQPDAGSELALSGRYTHNWVGGYAESFSTSNFFPVTSSSGSFDTLKAKARWTTELVQDLDLTLSGALGTTFSHGGMAANVMFVGAVNGASADDLFAEYGARLGWKMTPETTADVFVQGSTGTVSGTHAQVGTGLHVQF